MRMCILCHKRKAEVPDREDMGRRLKRVCLVCHRQRLAEDVQRIFHRLAALEQKPC
jgi:cytochrome c553